MNNRNLFQQAFVLTLVVLLLIGCGGTTVIPTATLTQVPLTPTSDQSPEVVGSLVDVDTEAPVKGAWVLLCTQNTAANCCLDQSLRAKTDADGAFTIQIPSPDDYVVLYTLGDTRSEWDSLCIDYGSIRTVWNSLGGGRMSSYCEGYYYFPEQDLAVIWMGNNPLTITASSGQTEVNLAIWTPNSNNCDAFQPFR